MDKIPKISNRRELTTHLRKIDMTNQDFADLIGYSTEAFKKWNGGKMPKWIPYVVGYLKTIKENEEIAVELGLSVCKKGKKK